MYEYEVIEQTQYEQSTVYSGSSLEDALEEYREYGMYSNGPLTLYRTDGKRYEWLCGDGVTFLPVGAPEKERK